MTLKLGRFFFHVIPAKAGIQRFYEGLLCLHSGKQNGTLYIGVTNDLIRRVQQHKNDFVPGFTNKYGVHKLVYYEQTDDIRAAIEREKQLKSWKRKWKLELIERVNPHWKDLYDELK